MSNSPELRDFLLNKGAVDSVLYTSKLLQKEEDKIKNDLVFFLVNYSKHDNGYSLDHVQTLHTYLTFLD